MNKKIEDYQLATSPTALDCRNLLENLSPVQESRQGKQKFAALYLLSFIFIYMPFVAYIMIYLSRNRFDHITPIIIPLMLSGLIVSMWFIAREYKLYAQNSINLIIKSMSPLFEDNEEFLTAFIGKAMGINTPSWINDSISTYCYFVFTTDRMIIITLSPKIAGIDQLAKHHTNNTFESVIDNIYTCSLMEEGKVMFGGIISQPMFNLSHTKLITIPENESEPYTWIIANKHTKNGKLLNLIITRLKTGYSKDF